MSDLTLGKPRKGRRVLPGFGLSMGYTIFYLCLIVLIPLAGLLVQPIGMGWDQFFAVVTSKRVLAAYWLSFYAAFVAAIFNTVAGFVVAWVLVRYRFPGSKILDSLVDLPFALPTAVAGIALTTLYSANGWLGGGLESLGIHVVNTPVGIMIAMGFIGFPFVVRTVQPVIQQLEPEMEEAALSLGASRWQMFVRVILPGLLPALLTGFTLAFARGIGEYGSVIFIAGNLPLKTEIAPLMIMSKLDQFDYAGAAAIALVLLIISFSMLLILNGLQSWQQKRQHGKGA